AGKDLGIAGLGEALVGMKVGEEKKVDLAFPNDASESDLAGKTGTFSIRPSQVAEKVLPALDDEFAKTVGVADIATLRNDIRKEWRRVAERRAKSLLVLDAIARKEGITVSGDELAAQATMSPLAQVDPQALRSPAVLASLARSIRNRKTVDKLVGLESPDAEREAIRKAGGDDFDFHGAAPAQA